jgi:hypothetical protein
MVYMFSLDSVDLLTQTLILETRSQSVKVQNQVTNGAETLSLMSLIRMALSQTIWKYGTQDNNTKC